MSTHGPIDPEFHDSMNRIAKVLDDTFNKDGLEKTVGFMLLTFPLGENSPHADRINYISNSVREDCICTLKEFIARAEGRHIEETQTPIPREKM